ncbi:exocyst complex component EXO70H1-like [Humulus lupulus]|uniref:exocyst complex component EXO70H1-like n=1 Tax=Humulus lupulus TaxID=3486 RepID=UPI002B415EDD|nr:exocyst complex component EXO70H1-like [Humulus lupulus]
MEMRKKNLTKCVDFLKNPCVCLEKIGAFLGFLEVFGQEMESFKKPQPKEKMRIHLFVEEFLPTTQHKDYDDDIRCPCLKCLNSRFHRVNTIEGHIFQWGFQESYQLWTFHGEVDKAVFDEVVEDNKDVDEMIDIVDNFILPTNTEETDETSPPSIQQRTWHYTGRLKEDGVLRHPINGAAWKDFDARHPEFTIDGRNVHLLLAADGFTPFGNMSLSYSMCPVVLTNYNLLPWLCMKEEYFMLTLLIPGPKSPRKDMDMKHNQDVMHVEKNVYDSLLGTLLDNDKYKGTNNARHDLKKMGCRKELWIYEDENKKLLKSHAPTELIFPVTFFVIMIDLVLHLPEEDHDSDDDGFINDDDDEGGASDEEELLEDISDDLNIIIVASSSDDNVTHSHDGDAGGDPPLDPTRIPSSCQPGESGSNSTPGRRKKNSSMSMRERTFQYLLHIHFSDSLMDEKVGVAQSVINKWESNDTVSLFNGDRQDARQYFNAVKDLQSAMQHFISQSSASAKLIRAQFLMETTMRRFQREFYHILSSNRQYLDPESVSSHSSRASTISSFSDFEEELRITTESISEVERVSMAAMADLRSIADCMISAGYAKECVKIYTTVRKHIIDEGLYRLGVEKMTVSQIQKMEWNVMELKIKSWLNAVKVSVKTLFYGERILCDHVFASSESIRESWFSEICGEGAALLFGFPEIVAKSKKSPEKMFRTLDLYEAITDLWPEISSIFSYKSTSAIRSLALTSLVRLGESVRTMLTDFESAILKDSSKKPVPAGGIHPLTRYVMNYISFLGDYSEVLSIIVSDWQLPVHSPLPESYFGSLNTDNEGSSLSCMSVRIGWLILVLLCKLDGKATLYKDVSLPYIFLANNLQYVIVKVQSSNLKLLLGEDWMAKHEAKVKQYVLNFERVGWNTVFSAIPEDPTADMTPEQAKEIFRKLIFSFQEAYCKQTTWVAPDPKLRYEIKASVANKIVPPYQAFYERHRSELMRLCGSDSVVRYTPENVDSFLSDLFFGVGSVESFPSSLTSSPS